MTAALTNGTSPVTTSSTISSPNTSPTAVKSWPCHPWHSMTSNSAACPQRKSTTGCHPPQESPSRSHAEPSLTHRKPIQMKTARTQTSKAPSKHPQPCPKPSGKSPPSKHRTHRTHQAKAAPRALSIASSLSTSPPPSHGRTICASSPMPSPGMTTPGPDRTPATHTPASHCPHYTLSPSEISSSP